MLKDLALSGFRKVQVIDLDTIDVSNLNRQLLFRSQHVGMAKCTVACQVAMDMVPPLPDENQDQELPPVQYQAYHGNVCDTSKFNAPFIQQFDLVLNALDNVEARRRVNRLCLASNVPLVEAGTTGYLGQVTVIHKGSNVACYECKTQETAKVYPICTIRSTPSAPVHCIVWAKELYKLFFHSKVEESMLYEPEEGEKDDGNEDGGEEGSGGPSTYMAAVTKVRDMLSSSPSAALRSDFEAAVKVALEALFCTEIRKQLDMGRYKAAKKTPSCLDVGILDRGIELGTPTTKSNTAIWPLEDNVAALVECLKEATARTGDENTPALLEEFDKDDDLAMRFVTASSNLRSSVFGIEPLQSLYSAKGIAGNIIPAIATTNAICAGLQILQAFKILKKQVELKASGTPSLDLQLGNTCLYVNCIRNRTRNGLYLTASPLEEQNPNCFVCRNAIIPLTINVNDDRWTLQEFLARVVKKRLGFEEPTLMLQGDIIWEEGDGADEEEFKGNLSKTLTNLPCGGIQNGSVLEIDDNSQNLCIQVAITHRDVWESEGDDDEVADFPFSVGAVPPSKTKTEETSGAKDDANPVASDSTPPAQTDNDDDDDDVLLVVDEDAIDSGTKKRSSKGEINEDNPTKKQKTAASPADETEVIEIE